MAKRKKSQTRTRAKSVNRIGVVKILNPAMNTGGGMVSSSG